MNRRALTQLKSKPHSRFIPIAAAAAILTLSGCSGLPGFGPEKEAQKPAAEQHHSKQESRQSTNKQAFFARMKPLVEQENSRIASQRARLLKLQHAYWLNDGDKRKIGRIAKHYELDIQGEPTAQQWQSLLARVDIIPVEMALVQAANESAWGSSRFAKQGNNYFGQWCYQKGCGIVPNARSEGATHEVQRFDSAAESVQAYMHNINTTRAYTEFRKLRATQRNKEQPLDAEHLVLGLKSYSERGMEYVRIIQAMIRSNRDLIAES